LSLGVLGVGPHWESDYRIAIDRLGPRGRIAVVAGGPWKATHDVAQGREARHAASVRSLMRVAGDGVIAATTDGYGWYPAELCVAAGRNLHLPVLDLRDPARGRAVQDRASELGLLIVPELRLRYTPSTLRLRELIVTDLGPISTLDVRMLSKCETAPSNVLREVIDWCRVVVGATPHSVQCREEPNSRPNARQVITLQFPAGKSTVGAIEVRLHLPPGRSVEEDAGDQSLAAADSWPLEFSVSCKYGEARLEDAVHLRWREGGRERIESLSTERTALSVSIDHFARRLAGGLIPVPNLAELLLAESIAVRAKESLSQGGRPVTCGDR
jgi:hypothetical protein